MTILLLLSMSAAAQQTAPDGASSCPTVTVLDRDRTEREGDISAGASLLSDLDDALGAVDNRYPASLHGALRDALDRTRELASFGGEVAPPRAGMARCSAVGPDIEVPEDFVAIDPRHAVVALDFSDSLPAVSPRGRSAAGADPRARGSQWAPDKIVAGAVRYYVVDLPALVNDLEAATRAARGTHPRWRDVASAVERARSRAQEAIRLYDASLVHALCRIGDARRSWPTHQAHAREALRGAAKLVGTDPALDNVVKTLDGLAAGKDTNGAAILRAEERLHGLLRARACATPASHPSGG